MTNSEQEGIGLSPRKGLRARADDPTRSSGRERSVSSIAVVGLKNVTGRVAREAQFRMNQPVSLQRLLARPGPDAGLVVEQPVPLLLGRQAGELILERVVGRLDHVEDVAEVDDVRLPPRGVRAVGRVPAGAREALPRQQLEVLAATAAVV
jgi:hypothetical protein